MLFLTSLWRSTRRVHGQKFTNVILDEKGMKAEDVFGTHGWKMRSLESISCHIQHGKSMLRMGDSGR